MTDLDSAKAALKKAEEDLERWKYQRDQRSLNLAEAERRLGEAVVNGVDPDAKVNKRSTEDALIQAADRLNRLRANKEAATAAVLAAEQRLETAQRDVFLAEAADLRDQAARLRRKAARRQRKTDELLEQLQEREGVPYVPKPPEKPDAYTPGVGLRVVPVAIPKTQTLLNQAQALEDQAAQLQKRADDTPAAREQRRAAEKAARAEWMEWEQRDFERKQEEEAKAAGRKVRERPLGV